MRNVLRAPRFEVGLFAVALSAVACGKLLGVNDYDTAEVSPLGGAGGEDTEGGAAGVPSLIAGRNSTGGVVTGGVAATGARSGSATGAQGGVGGEGAEGGVGGEGAEGGVGATAGDESGGVATGGGSGGLTSGGGSGGAPSGGQSTGGAGGAAGASSGGVVSGGGGSTGGEWTGGAAGTAGASSGGAESGGGTSGAPAGGSGAGAGGEGGEGGGATTLGCTDECQWAGDGACDDGGPDSEYTACDFGTDCTDCGARDLTASCSPLDPTPGCGVGMRCLPGFTAGLPPVCLVDDGARASFDDCETYRDCTGADLCISWTDTGSGVCAPLCRNTADCATGLVCWDLQSPRYIGDQAWGVCGPDVGDAPPGWTCDPAIWGDGVACDCGCGVFDADCEGRSIESCDGCADPGSCATTADCASSISPTTNSVCLTCLNTCATASDGSCQDGGADAGDLTCAFGSDCTDCGVRDPGVNCTPLDPEPDCGPGSTCLGGFVAGAAPLCGPSAGSTPSYGYCSAHSDCVASDLCIDLNTYGAGVCLKQCRVGGADCAVAESCVELEYPRYTHDQAWGVCAPDVGAAPPAWRCDATFWAFDGDCDCGCGAFDPDCPDTTVSSCDYCADTGSCAVGSCPSNIQPDDNSTCTAG